MKRILLLFLLACIVFSFSACVELPFFKDEVEPNIEAVLSTINTGDLIVGVSADFPPYEYINQSGEFAGVEIEMLAAIAKKLGLRIRFENIYFDELFSALLDQQVDCIMGGMEYTSYRQEIANVSNTLFTDEDQFHSVIYIEKSNIDLQIAINNAIYELQQDGTFETILNKYGIKHS